MRNRSKNYRAAAVVAEAAVVARARTVGKNKVSYGTADPNAQENYCSIGFWPGVHSGIWKRKIFKRRH